MRERMCLVVAVGWCLSCASLVEAGNGASGVPSCSSNVVTVAPAATFAVPTIVGSVVAPSVTTVVPQSVVVSPAVTVPTVTVVPQAAATPLVVRQRIRVPGVQRLGLRSLLCR